jgi:N-acetylmuramoyl-L-alanine amidase
MAQSAAVHLTMRGRLLALVPPLALVLSLAGATPVTAAPEPTAAGPGSLAGRVVAIDPGHQLGNGRHSRQINRQVWVGLWKPCNTTGTATNSGYPEATFTWRVATALRYRLEALGATVRMTRTSNSTWLWGPCVNTRGRFGAREHADVEISIHADGAASATHGFFVIRPGWRRGYTDDIYRPSRALSTSVHSGLAAAGFRPSNAYGGDGYDVRRDLGTLNMSDVPTVMVELGNMRNAREARCMRSTTCRGRYAAGLAAGLRGYLLR